MDPTTERISETGSWWLSDDRDSRLFGTVTYGPSAGLELELVGALFPTENTPQFQKSLCVWGTTVRNKEVSLLNAHITSIRTHIPGTPVTKVSAYEGVIGGFYRSLEDVVIHTVDVEFDYLAAWTAESGITEKHNPERRGSVISVEPALPIHLGNANGIDITIEPYVSQTHSRNGIVLRDSAQLRLRSPDSRPYQDFQLLIGSFTRLLTLAVGEPAPPTRTVGSTSEKAHEVEGKPIWREVEIIRQRTKVAPKDIFADEMLFTLRDLREHSEMNLHSFLHAETKLRPVLDLLLLDYFHPQLPIPQEFLNFVNALEGLHYLTIGGQYLEDEEYRSLVEPRLRAALPPDLPDEFRQSLEVRLKTLHRFTLRKRLRDILHKFEAIIAPYVGDISRFVDSVITLRNALLHSAKQPMPSYGELWKVSQILALILEAAVLVEFGFSANRVRGIVARGKKARRIQTSFVAA